MIGSQISLEKQERDRRASGTFRLSDTLSKSIAARPEATHLAPEVGWIAHTLAQVGSSRKALVLHNWFLGPAAASTFERRSNGEGASVAGL